jgi:hypothetical protein
MPTQYTKEQLVDALVNEWEYLCHDCPEEGDATPEEKREEYEKMTVEELIKATDTDYEGYPLDDYMQNHCNLL